VLKSIGGHRVSVQGVVAVQPYKTFVGAVYGLPVEGARGTTITYSSGAVVKIPAVSVDEVYEALYGPEQRAAAQIKEALRG
jgi:hypothetical protein